MESIDRTAPEEQPRKQVNNKKANKGQMYVLWALEILIASLVLFVGIIICSFCKYTPQEIGPDSETEAVLSDNGIFTQYSIDSAPVEQELETESE